MGSIQQAMLSQSIAATVGGYLVSEDDTAGTTASGWTDSGSVNWGYTPALVGSFSINCPASTSNGSLINFAAQGEVYGFFRLSKNGTPTNTNEQIISFRNSSNLPVATLVARPAALVHRVMAGSTSSGTGASIANNTALAIWLHYLKGTGANSVCDVYIQTDGTENKPGAAYLSVTGGNATTDCSRLAIAGVVGADMTFDKIRVSTTAIGSNPT